MRSGCAARSSPRAPSTQRVPCRHARLERARSVVADVGLDAEAVGCLILPSSLGSMSTWTMLRARTELRRLAGRAVVEADAETDQEVAFLEHEVGAAGRVHADHAEEERMVVRQRAEAEQRRGDGDRRRLDEPRERVAARPPAITPAPTSNDRPLRRDRSARRRARRPRRGARQRIGRAGLRQTSRASIGSFCTSFGMSITTGPGRPDAAMRNASGTTLEQLGRRAHQEVVLRDRHREAVGVDLLERVGADHRARHLSGDGDERDRVELGVGDRGRADSSRPGPRCRSRRPAGPSRGPSPAR